MIIAFVQFNIPFEMSLDDARTRFLESAEFFQKAEGLKRKYYLFDGKTGGGVYVWENREVAEKMYDERFRKTIEEKYGNIPTVRYIDVPVLVDNTIGEIIT
jgi:hypothetical protein